MDVIGTSKGRGFAGLVKRHHFRGGPASHGSMFHRAAGSIGASSFPSRVFPGMKMAGRMGADQVTVRNLEIVSVDTEDNVIAVKGAIPGPNGGYVMVRRAQAVRHPKDLGKRERTMPSVDIVDLNNAAVGSIELSDAVFGAEVNEALLYEAVRQYTAASRSGTRVHQDAP